MRGSLREKRSGVWELRVPIPRDPITGARRQRSVTFRGTKREAQRELARLVAEADQGGGTGTRATVNDLLDRWWEQKREQIEATTAREYQRLIERRLRPGLGTKRLQQLSPADLDAYYLRLSREGLSPASVRQLHAIVSGALKQAVKWRWIPSNPARDATLPRARRPKVVPPSPDKVRLLVRSAEEDSMEMGMFVRLTALLGCRRSEACGLRWSDIDTERSSVRIHRAVVDVAGRLVEKGTKTHADRLVALDRATLAMLVAYRQAVEERARACDTELIADAYVLSPAADGSLPLRPDKATATFTRLRKAVGLEGARIHDLRHYVATQLISAGHDVRTVAGRLGHAQTATTLNTYAAFVQASDQAAADALAELLADEGGT